MTVLHHALRRWGRWLLVSALVLGMLVGQMRSASGAITSTTPVGGGYINITSLTWSQPVAAGSNRLMLVRLAHVNSNVTVTSVTYGGTALTQLSTATNGSSATALRVTIFYLVAPAVGTANVVVNYSGSVRAVGASTVHTGISQTTPFGTVATNSGTSNAPAVTATGVAGDQFVDIVSVQGTGGNAQTVGSGQVNAAFGSTGSTTSDVLGMASEKPATGSSSTLSWTQSSSAQWLSMGVALKAFTATVSGTVYEDVNYGGGPGRSLAASSGTGLAGATVELYNAAGSYVSSTTTAAGGGYTFTGVAADSTFHVRVVNSSVRSARTGSNAAAVGVMTYRTAYSGSVTPVSDHVGGKNPALVDPGSASSGAALNTGTGVYSAGLSGTAQSLAPVTVVQANVSGIDFGFNFDTVVNTNDSGQGSLRQAIVNANTLGGDGALAQGGRPGGVENLVFMIPNGSTGSGGSLGLAAGGLRSTLNAFSSGVASIAPASALPDIGTVMRIDARTQPGWTAAPVVELNGTNAGAGSNGFNLTAGSSTVAGFTINRFNAAGIQAVNVGSHTIAGNYVGLAADGSTASPNQNGLNLYNVGSSVVGGTTAADRNVVSGNGNVGVVITGSTSTGIALRGNYIGTNAAGTGPVANGSLGIYMSSPGNTVGGTAGNVVSGNTYQGIFLDSGASGTTLQGNVIGLDANGALAVPNGAIGLYVASSGNTIGGTTAGSGNTISGNNGAGVQITGSGATGNVLKGNTIGLNSAGDTARPNSQAGVLVDGGSATIGGITASDRNVISGNTQDGINITGGTVTVQGNHIGANKAGTAALGNGGDGVDLAASGATIGGTATGAGNVIRGNGGRGVSIASGARTGNSVLGNAIYGNANIGIDLGADGATANDGLKNSSLPNSSMDTPVFTSATLVGTTLTVSGYVGSAAGQASFGNARVEIFQSDASSANGQGQAYLGFLLADGSGNFSGSLTVSGLTANSSRITATATDSGNNTSEFAPNVLAAQCSLSGTVFEDLNYAGGAGRTLAASGGAAVNGATVELYNASGSYVSSTTTAGGGTYSFTNLPAGSYHVRVASGTVLSTRSGAVSTLRGVLTYRTSGASGSAVAVTDGVGGTNPALADPGSASSGAAFNTGSYVFSAVLSGTAHAVAPVTVASGSVTGLDFGFNFDTVVNTNDSGQGSLRQAITNANTLGGDAALAQSGRTAGIENLVFMLGNGSNAAGLRSANNFFTTAAGSANVATIALASALTTVSSPLVLDAQTQPGWNSAPLIELNGAGAGAGATGFTLNAAGATLRGFVINRFTGDGVTTTSGAGVVIQGNYIGLNAAGTAASANGSSGIWVNSSANNHVIGGSTAALRNVIAGQAGSRGIHLFGGSGHVIRGNYIGTDVTGTLAIGNKADGIKVSSGVTSTTIGGVGTGDGNLIRSNGNRGIAIDAGTSTGIAMRGNSIFGNGGGNALYIGIDLDNDGPTANDGAKGSGANAGMDYPVFNAASVAGTTLTVSGYVGSAAGQGLFAGALVDVYASDASNASGQGQTYLGTLTADGNGNFSGSIGGVGLSTGAKVTATATDGSGNTSEFGPNVTVGQAISGTVFEDLNYGGGAGRTLAASSGAGVSGARVELYDGTGSFVSATTTASNGSYRFGGLAGSRAYFVRVVNSTVLSTRSGSSASLVPVMTYRTEAGNSSAVAVSNEVGGTKPAAVDAPAGASGTTLWTQCAIENSTCSFTGTRTVRYGFTSASASGWSTLVLTGGTACTNGVFGDPLVGTVKYCYLLNADYQSVSTVYLGSADVSGNDFGFNFDTVANVNDSGPGSLRQAITNANTLGGDASLAQAGRTAAIENLVFMISNGSSSAGLRSSNNYVASAAATLTPASALPQVTAPLVIDAQTQPGWSAAPVVALRGESAGSTAHGLSIGSTAAGSVVRGLSVGGFGQAGVYIAANTVTVEGVYAGLAPDGSTLRANATANASMAGVYLASGNGVVVGGSSSTQRNVLSGNAGAGFWAAGGTATLYGNYIGTDAAGGTAKGNTSWGVVLNSTGPHRVGGATTGQGNVISGQTANNAGGIVIIAGTGHIVQGNTIGLNATRSAAVPNGLSTSNFSAGIDVRGGSGHQIGGTVTGEGNVIASNQGMGVRVTAQSTRILGNSIYGNVNRGIDLNADGVTVNDGATNSSQPNNGMDQPVFTTAAVSGTTLTVSGYVGSAAGQSIFNGARVEVFVSDGDASGYGQGKTFVGFLTADASGNFSGSLALPGGATVTNGASRITGTATDTANNTSEFGANFTVGQVVSGRVFEDLNYGGGAGRSQAAAGGVGLANATVEIYAGSGSLSATTTTASDGSYAFNGLGSGGYLVRVVLGTVRSSRAGSSAALLPVQTWRYEASWNTPAAVTNEVGGARPDTADSAAAAALSWVQCATESGGSSNPCAFTGTRVVRFGTGANWTLRVATGGVTCSSAVFGDPAAGSTKSCEVLTPHLHSASSVQLVAANVSGVDFGYSFDVVTNTNDSGQGSLRQAITNANTLGGDTSLAQSGRSAGTEHLVFMISNGSSAAGLRSANSSFSGGVATITPLSALPTVSTTMVIDAQAQPGWATNPIVRLAGGSAGAADGLTLAAANAVLRGFIVNSYTGNGIVLASGSDGSTLQGNWVGLASSGTAAAGNTLRGIAVNAGAGLLIGGSTASQRNVVSGNGGEGVYVGGGSVVVSGNYIGTNASGLGAVPNAGEGGLLINGGNGSTVGGMASGAGNVISGNTGRAVTVYSGSHTLQGNSLGLNASGTAALVNTGGSTVYLGGAAGAQTIGGLTATARNVIVNTNFHGINIAVASAAGTVVQGNYIGTDASGANVLGGITSNGLGGVFINGTATGITVGGTDPAAANLIRGFGVGVLVSSGSGNAVLGNSIYGNRTIGIDIGGDGVTANDGARTTGQPNLRMDFPVFTSARARGNQLTVAGYVGSAAGQSVFSGSRVEVFVSDDDSTGYGEGKTYLGTLTADGSGGFSGSFTMPVATLALGTRLTGTATDGAGNTSEFGPNFTGLQVDLVVNSNLDEADSSPGDGYCLTASGVCTLRAALAESNAVASLPATPTVAFALPGCTATGAAGCTITPATALPSVTRAMVIDGSTQAGTRSVASACAPLVELDGSGAPASSSGLVLAADGSTVRGLSVGGFGQSGISISASNVAIECNHVGLRADGSTVRANGSNGSATGGVYVNSGSSIFIGGSTAAQRNVLSGNGGSGVWVAGGTATISGNHIGTDALGNTAAGNRRWGVTLAAPGQMLGGSASGAGNLISGNVASATGGVLVFAAGQTIQGNRIGTNAAGSGFIANGDASSPFAAGIDVRPGFDGQTIGGTGTGEANVIAGNNGHGIRVAAQAVRISGNSIYGNTWLGIDLNADGVTANDGATNSSAPNSGMDHPVLNGAGINSTATGMTVSGAVGTGTGQAAFAGARIEFFKAAPDASGYGEGQTYLGFLIADANGRFSGNIAFASGLAAVGDAITATATDAAGNTSEFGPNWTSTTVAALTPAGFNAFDTDAAASALSGVIRSRTAGAATNVAVIALDASGTALHAGFTGSVSLRWLDARNDSGAVTGTCRASWVDLGSAGTASFSNNARVTVALTPPAAGTRSMRLQMSYSGPSGSVTACSNDAFAALPASLAWVGASDADAATAGTARVLANVGASGGVVHRAGRPFTLRAQAIDATGALMTGYDGTPALALTGCVLPGGCSAGTFTATATAAVAGSYSNSSASYAEVGAITLTLSDGDYASVDAGDTAPAARTIASGNLNVGRFVPDGYTASVSTSGVLATANGACLASGSGATFIGQGFGWATAPQVTLTARNAAGGTTALWTGALMKLTPGGGLGASLAASGSGAAGVAASYGGFGVADLGGGQARVTASSTDRFVLDMATGTVQPSVTPAWAWALAVTDTSEAAVAGNPTLLASATQVGVGFDRGAVFHSGRLALAPGYGDARAGVRLVAQLQRYTAAGWVTMTEDEGCVTVQPQNLGVATPSGVFASAGLCAAPLTAAATTRGGRAWLTLPATPGAAPGRLQMQLAGDAASGSACSGAGALQPVVPLGLPWLLGGSSATGPQALGTWGSTQRDTVLRRETW